MATKDKTAEGASTELDTVKAQQIALMQQSMEEDAGGGFEEAGASAYAIPFLQILQSGSPQCKKSDGAYIKGAEEGMLFNTVTQELYDGTAGIEVIPVHYTQRFIEWKRREDGGGFVAEHMQSQPTTKDDKGRDMLPNGNTLVDTRNHFVMIRKADGTLTPAQLTMSSTQLKKSRQWMSLMNGIKLKTNSGFVTAPMFSHVYKITTVPEKNDKGSWFGFAIENLGKVEDIAEYVEAKAFRDAIKSGAAKPVMPVEEGMAETAEEF